MNHRKLEDIIRQTNFEALGLSPKEGDCGSIAVALKDMFGGEFVGVTEEVNGNIPCHVAIRIDGKVYDGHGKSSLTTFFKNFVVDKSNIESNHYWSEKSIPAHMIRYEKVDEAKKSLQKSKELLSNV